MGFFSDRKRNSRKVTGPSRAVEPSPAQPPPVPDPKPQQPDAAPSSRYGIEDVIAVLRGLPLEGENASLVVRVLKRTLESTSISVSTIIDDATRKQSKIRARIDELQRTCNELEREIRERESEIDSLQKSFEETLAVRRKIESALQRAEAEPPGEAVTPPTAASPDEEWEEATDVPVLVGEPETLPR